MYIVFCTLSKFRTNMRVLLDFECIRGKSDALRVRALARFLVSSFSRFCPGTQQSALTATHHIWQWDEQQGEAAEADDVDLSDLVKPVLERRVVPSTIDSSSFPTEMILHIALYRVSPSLINRRFEEAIVPNKGCRGCQHLIVPFSSSQYCADSQTCSTPYLSNIRGDCRRTNVAVFLGHASDWMHRCSEIAPKYVTEGHCAVLSSEKVVFASRLLMTWMRISARLKAV